MIDIVADLHLHSKYSRAVSPQMTTPVMAQVAEQKGIELLATGDWTHPFWLRELKNYLTEAEEGLYKIKHPTTENEQTRFLLSVEIATIYSQGGKGRRIHQIVFVPSFETAEKVNKELSKRGFNLASDGRPIIGLSSKNLLALILEIDEKSMLIPAHVWTPWFGVYGQLSGFRSLGEAFEDMAPYVYGIETGLSSDPEMNWQMKELQTRSILSFSDAHSPAKMGREATIFQLGELSYENIRQAIMKPSQKDPKHNNRVAYTIEFYPEEGKYHYSGHRKCHVSQTPEEQYTTKSLCPVCKRKVTDGVMRRVGELADQTVSPVKKANGNHVVWITDSTNIHPPFVKIVPFNEIIAEAIGSPAISPKVKRIFDGVCKKDLSEFNILLKASIQDIEKALLSVTSGDVAKKIAEGVEKVRKETIFIKPGFDGVYGVVKIWNESQAIQTETKQKIAQSSLDI